MPRFREPTESELLGALQRCDAQDSTPHRRCPERSVWQKFSAGEYSSDVGFTAILLTHLADCDECEQILKQLKTAKTSRVTLIAAFSLMAAVIAIVAVLWIRSDRQGTLDSAVTEIDLRNASPLRGSEPAGDEVIARLSTRTRALRIFLPTGSMDGAYEYIFYRPGQIANPVTTGSANALFDGGNVIFTIKLPHQLTPGTYILGLRYGEAGWDSYGVQVK